MATASTVVFLRHSQTKIATLAAKRTRPTRRSAWASESNILRPITTHSGDAVAVIFEEKKFLIMPKKFAF